MSQGDTYLLNPCEEAHRVGMALSDGKARRRTDLTVRDPHICRSWREGNCHVLTLALHEVCGWTPYGLFEKEPDEGIGYAEWKGDLCHSGLRTPDGVWLVDGHGWTPCDEESLAAIATSYGIAAGSYLWSEVSLCEVEDSFTDYQRNFFLGSAYQIVARLLRNAPPGVREYVDSLIAFREYDVGADLECMCLP